MTELVTGDEAPATSYGHSRGDLTVPQTSEPDMKKTNKPQGEEKVSIYMKESQVERMPGEASTCQTRSVVQSNSVHHLCSNRSILQEVDKEEEVEEPEHNQQAVTWGRSHSASGM